ncbi:hypothetical protein BGX28_008746 [Mortierella sp. GBA30]|nr:hypothetical protein BGX28_008746 [Mortierella sp. GBA30]
MSDEPRRKRKWDTQGEEESASKKAASDDTTAAPEGHDEAPAQTQTAAEAAAAAAAIAAAKINAMLVAKGQAPVAPAVETDGSGAAKLADSELSGSGSGQSTMPAKGSKERDEFVADIDINDVQNRYMLTKGQVQTELQRDTGADVTTRGRHYADRSLATEKDPPLYLHVTALTQDALDLAVKKINELIEEAQNPAPLPPQRESFYPPSRTGGGPPRHLSFHARVAIGIESERMFNVRAKIVGPQGQYVKHVQNETRTRVQLKGRGSGYLEEDTRLESDEPLYINILGHTQEDVDAAENLCKDLVETVRAEHEKMKSRPPVPQEPYGHGRYGGRPSHYNSGYHHGRYQGSQHSQYQQQPRHDYNYNQQYHTPPPPPPPGVPAPPSNPPLPPGPPPPPPAEQPATSAAASAPGTSAAAADPSTQAYSYDQYEAYNQYYYQQQYYQQYGQYYQQAYAQPGAEQAAGSGAVEGSTATAPVSVDPALAYYGYAYAAPPPPTTTSETTSSATETTSAPPPPPPSGTSDSHPSS